MRIITSLLFLFIVCSCGTASHYPDKTNPCYQMHGNKIFKNGGDDISIYIGSVRTKGGRSWEDSPDRPFEISDTAFNPWIGYAAGFSFSVPTVEEVTVSLNGAPPVRYKRLKLDHPDYVFFTLNAKEDFWVPPSFPRHGFRVPELPQGDYRIQVRYRANGRELLAHWHITYRPPGGYKAPLAPTCSIELRTTKPGLPTTIRRDLKRANTSWVATADKFPRSLCSINPALPCHHI